MLGSKRSFPPHDDVAECRGSRLQPAPCRLDSCRRLHAPVARVDRPPPSTRMLRGFDSWPELHRPAAQRKSAEILTSEDVGSISCRGRHFWRANPPGRGRRLLTAWCRKAWESCSQLSAKRVWYRRMCPGLPNRRGGINTRGPLQFRPLPLRWLGDSVFTRAKPDRRRQGAP